MKKNVKTRLNSSGSEIRGDGGEGGGDGCAKVEFKNKALLAINPRTWSNFVRKILISKPR